MKPFTIWMPLIDRYSIYKSKTNIITHLYYGGAYYMKAGKIYPTLVAGTTYHNHNSRGVIKFNGVKYYPT